MTTKEIKRKLAAILSADVKGYSRLMGGDEERTIRTLKEYKEVMGSLIQQHRGRVVDATGDNLMAEFASVVDAVQGAVEIQVVLRAKNALLPENRRMEFRIGINLGDVIEEGEGIYGDGVNIAARLEGLAEAGGICISGSAYEQIENKLPLRYDYLGEHEVKNIARPVRVYRAQIDPEVVVRKPLEVASKEKMAFPLPDKPSIAVLPFVNMSDDPKQEYFSDGLTEEIITGLSKIPNLFVIARNSTFTYKGKAVKIKQVSEELGVRYVLEGSVRRSGEKVRITAQLIDAMTGYHLWAERYDRDLKDVFAIQDEITMKIISAMQVKLTKGESASISEGTESLEAYLKVLEGRELMNALGRDDNISARKRLEEAIALDPKYAAAYAILSFTYVADFIRRINPEESMKKAFECTQKALSLDDSQPLVYTAMEFMYGFRKQHDQAVAAGEKAVSIAPGSADAQFSLGRALNYACRDKEALIHLENAVRMNPFPPAHYFMYVGTAHLNLGNHEEAVSALKKALTMTPKNEFARYCLIVAYVEMGRMEEARAEAQELSKIYSKVPPPELFEEVSPWKDPKVTERYIEAYRKLR